MLHAKKITTSAVIAVTIMLGGCADKLNNTQKDTLGGAAIGAAAGAGIGAIVGGSGAVGTGALIGTAVGAVGGAMVSDGDK